MGPVKPPPQLVLRTKIFLALLAVIAFAVVTVSVLSRKLLDGQLRDRTRDDLGGQVALVAHEVAALTLPMEPTGAWSVLARDLADRARARVTLIRRDGVVLADSEASSADIARAGNHAARPEVAEALTRGAGSSQRMSATVHRSMLYVARVMRRGGEMLGVARLAVPTAEVDEAFARFGWKVWSGSTLALILSAALALFFARSLAPAADTVASLAGGGTGGLTAPVPPVVQRRARDGLLELMFEGVLVVDQRGAVALVNRAMREMLLLGGDVIGKPAKEIIRHPGFAQALAGPAATDAVIELDLEGWRPRRLLVAVGPIPGSAGLVALVTDVTAVRTLQSLRQDLVAGITDGLRGSLAPAIAATASLSDAPLTDENAARASLEIIEGSVRRLQRIVEQLLDRARVEKREFRLVAELAEFEPVARRVLRAFEDRARRGAVRMLVEVPSILGGVVADSRALEYLLARLVENALEACERSGAVVVRAIPQGRWVRIAVSPGRLATGRDQEMVRRLAEALGGRLGDGEDQSHPGTVLDLPRA